MSHYKHLTLIERECIMYYCSKGLTVTEIANILNRDKSTVSRELHRNSIGEEYLPYIAQKLYEKRREGCHPIKKLDNAELLERVRHLFLDLQWSPEQIQHRIEYEDGCRVISYATIYRGICDRLFDEPNLSSGSRGAIRKLRHHGKSRHTKDYEERRGKIQISHDIDERPDEAKKRERLGDWEADTVAGVTGKSCLVTLDDRMSRFLKAKRIIKKTSLNVKAAMIELLSGEPLESITPDRGKEFSRHKEITEVLDVEFYFPKPHAPWQRGTNENTNGLIREYLPKGKEMDSVTDEYINDFIDKLNKRPRKCLGWKTPYEVHYNKVLHLT